MSRSAESGEHLAIAAHLTHGVAKSDNYLLLLGIRFLWLILVCGITTSPLSIQETDDGFRQPQMDIFPARVLDRHEPR